MDRSGMTKVGMTKIGVATLLGMALSAGACSNIEEAPERSPPPDSIGEFIPSSRVQFDGALLEVGPGGRLGLIDIQVSATQPDKIFAETILIQRHPAGSPFDATSQVIEIECDRHRHRIVANLSYNRAGTLLSAMPVDAPFSDFAVYQRVYDALCDGSYARAHVTRFTSIAGFLDLFETADGTASPEVVLRGK